MSRQSPITVRLIVDTQAATDTLDRLAERVRELGGMTVWVHSYPGDGNVIVMDGQDSTLFKVKIEEWHQIRMLPNERQRAALDHIAPARKEV